MYLKTALQLTLASTLPASTFNSPSTTPEQQPGYSPNTPSTVPGTPNFGTNYAVLHLDLINGLVGNVSETKAGQEWINAPATWINTYPILSIHLIPRPTHTNGTRVHDLYPAPPSP